MMNVLVTGGAGYLGSILVDELLCRHAVTVVDTFAHRENSLAHLCHCSHFNVVRGDARDSNVMLPLLRQADAIIPLAAIVGAPACDADPVAAYSTNVEAIELICKYSSREAPIIIPISNSGYGIGEPGEECTEESPLRPVSHYGKTKVEAEKRVLERGNAISLRLATAFGMSPRMRLDLLVNDFTWRAVTDRALVLYEPHFKRNYVHVHDVARAFSWCLERCEAMEEQATGVVYNVGLSDANLTKLELCEAIRQQVPGFTFLVAQHGEDPDKRDYVVSNAKIEAAGFETAHPLESGIHELIKGYRMLRPQRYSNA
jgi:nucleoside-diphosphate-sugar epimerase